MTRPTPTCSFCGKEHPLAKRLMIAVNFEQGGETRSSICADCLGVQMVVLAGWDPELFESLVEAARTNAIPPPQP